MARKLVLHFDVNETIMVGDPASSVDFESSLNHILAKAAFLSEDKTSWHDGSPLDLAKRKDLGLVDPPPLLTSFDAETGPRVKSYEANRRNDSWPAAKFSDLGTPGEIYRPIFEELKEKLRWKSETSRVFAPDGHHFLLPAFFHTLAELEKEGRDFSLVIRTFGTDLPEVQKCLQAFAQGDDGSKRKPLKTAGFIHFIISFIHFFSFKMFLDVFGCLFLTHNQVNIRISLTASHVLPWL